MLADNGSPASIKIGNWVLSEDKATGDLVFTYSPPDGRSTKQAVLRNPLRSNACPGTKLAKWCMV
jgi:hypothetical protein